MTAIFDPILGQLRTQDTGVSGGTGAPNDAYYVLAKANTSLTNSINLATLSNGILKHTVSGSVSTISIATTADADLILPSQTGNSGKFLTTDGTNSSWGTISGGWSLTGNAGTTAGTNFVGTTDDIDLIFKRNGIVCGMITSSGAEGNTSFGNSSNIGHLTANNYNNSTFGSLSGRYITGGRDNSFFGITSGYLNKSGSYNTAVGSDSLNKNETGNNITALGASSGYNSLGSNGVFLGSYAGKYETGGDCLYIDNQDRTNTAGDKAGALLYGVFDATPTSQTLKINAVTTIAGGAAVSTNFNKILVLGTVSIYKSDGTTPNAALSGTAGDICFNGDSGKAYYCTGTTNWTAL